MTFVAGQAVLEPREGRVEDGVGDSWGNFDKFLGRIHVLEKISKKTLNSFTGKYQKFLLGKDRTGKN